MAVALEGYYDGSGTQGRADKRRIIVLAGYAAAPAVWREFEAEWWETLKDDSARPACRCLHMREAKALRGEFTAERGWTPRGVRRLLADLFNRCLAPRGGHREVEESLVGASCWVDLDAYDRVCVEYPHFRAKSPEALCVDHVVGSAIRQLIPDQRMLLSELVQRDQSIDLYFDRGERYRDTIQKVWQGQRRKRRPLVQELVHNIRDAERTNSPAIQAADFLAWHTNRDVNSDPGDFSARLTAWLATRCVPESYDYEHLVKTAASWRANGGYNAVRQSALGTETQPQTGRVS